MSKTILIVEDEEMLQDAYKIILTSQGYDVHTASDGVEGMKKIKALKPDLVLLDIFMPVMDGKEFMRNIDMADYPKTKIVVYSNLSDKKIENELLSLGAHNFVLKSSMSPREMLTLVEQTLNDTTVGE